MWLFRESNVNHRHLSAMSSACSLLAWKKYFFVLYKFNLAVFQWNALTPCVSSPPPSPPQFDVIKSSIVRQYKNFQIEETPEGYHLYGTDTVRPTLGELLQHLESQNLRSDNHHFQLVRCCPPQPRGELKDLGWSRVRGRSKLNCGNGRYWTLLDVSM